MVKAVEYSILCFSLSLSLLHTHTPHLAARDEKERFGIVGVPGRTGLAHAHWTIDVYRTAVTPIRYPR
jgi:hypothetical protein